ncbi:hypothetical protein ADK38_07600, partial [Streptomyces varsoviensis]
MFRTALRNVLAHKARLLMTVLAVMLGVAFVSGTLVFTSTISSALQKSSEKGFTNTDIAITPSDSSANNHNKDGDGPSDWHELPQSLLKKVAKTPGVDQVTGTVSG